MFKALVIKELRESARIIALAVLGVLVAVAALTGSLLIFPLSPFSWTGSTLVPFVHDSFTYFFLLVIGSLAIALGFRQSGGEVRRGTFYFLLHRPATRKFIFGTKLAVGASVVFVVGALLILLHARWAATPGNVAAPFYWSMTKGAWQECLAMVLLYLGAFLSGLRPARWFSTRLMPLVAAAGLTFLIAELPWLWLTMIAVAVAASLFLASIFDYAVQRDY